MTESKKRSWQSVEDWQELMFLYQAALNTVETKLEIMKEEFKLLHQYNPIEYINSRIKSASSIAKKLTREGYAQTIDNMVEYVSDIAGIRVICPFTTDIYRLAEKIGKQTEFSVIYVKDYIRHPKPSGYRSYHMHIEVPIQTEQGIVPTKVELQIRTIAMDFWASLEHKIYYKFEGEAPDYISQDLQACAKIVADLDEKMLSLNEAIMQLEKKE